MQQLTHARAILSTTRPLRSFLLYLTVYIGFILSGRDWNESLIQALPALTISLAGFCINDIFDQETDRINHPDRALASFPALSPLVTALYVILFISAIVSIFMQQNSEDRFVWSIVFILLANYSFFKRSAPLLKNAYMAGVACIMASIYKHDLDFDLFSLILYAPLFLAVLAKELALDIPDAPGDRGTLAVALGPRRSLVLAIALYALALSAALALANKWAHFAVLTIGCVSLFFYLIARFAFQQRERSLVLLLSAAAASPAILAII